MQIAYIFRATIYGGSKNVQHDFTAAVIGVEAKAVQVEADVCDGLPMFCMVGDLSTEVREAADRVRTALRNTGIAVPPKR